MLKETISKEIAEVKRPEADGIKDIKPETNISKTESNHFWNHNIFKREKAETKEAEYFNSYEDRLGCTPKEVSDLGHWEGERGESKFIPNSEIPKGEAAAAKLKEKGLDGIEYQNAEPDFSKVAEATVEIDHMTENRWNYFEADGTPQLGNFSQADLKCADAWNAQEKDKRTDWTARDVAEWRQENRCSWHERCDTKTMDLVSYDVHGYCLHLGGVSECKVRDSIDAGGGFDE